jgi:ribonuclease PH
MALINAGVAMTDFVIGASAAVVDKTVLLDPTQLEASNATAVVPVAILARSRRIVLCQASARLPAAELKEAVVAAVEGATGVFGVCRSAVHDHALGQLGKRGLLTDA